MPPLVTSIIMLIMMVGWWSTLTRAMLIITMVILMRIITIRHRNLPRIPKRIPILLRLLHKMMTVPGANSWGACQHQLLPLSWWKRSGWNEQFRYWSFLSLWLSLSAFLWPGPLLHLSDAG